MARVQVKHGLKHAELIDALRSRPFHREQVSEFEGTATLIVFTRAEHVRRSGSVERALRHVDLMTDDNAFAVVRDLTREAAEWMQSRGIVPLFDNAQGGVFWSDESYGAIRERR